MWNLNYESAKEIGSVMEENGLAMSKKFGQNFLTSRDARERLRGLIDAKQDMRIWEIGPGLGSITSLLLESGAYVTAFEIDHGFAELLREKAFKDEERFSLVEGDALKTLFVERERPDMIVGNLPYNVGSQIIARLIENNYLPERMVFTLQKEVVERMTSKPNEEDYSSFSVLTQLDYENKLSLVLSKACFWPQPKVDSAVVVMSKREESLCPSELRPLFLKLVRALFSQRRKTIKNNLISSELSYVLERNDKLFESAGLSGSERAEALSFDKLLSLALAIKDCGGR